MRDADIEELLKLPREERLRLVELIDEHGFKARLEPVLFIT
jgi:hypothetical protein